MIDLTEEKWMEDFIPCFSCGEPNDNNCLLCDECAKTARCPHGKIYGECDTCDYEGDLAFDANREK